MSMHWNCTCCDCTLFVFFLVLTVNFSYSIISLSSKLLESALFIDTLRQGPSLLRMHSDYVSHSNFNQGKKSWESIVNLFWNLTVQIFRQIETWKLAGEPSPSSDMRHCIGPICVDKQNIPPTIFFSHDSTKRIHVNIQKWLISNSYETKSKSAPLKKSHQVHRLICAMWKKRQTNSVHSRHSSWIFC